MFFNRFRPFSISRCFNYLFQAHVNNFQDQHSSISNLIYYCVKNQTISELQINITVTHKVVKMAEEEDVSLFETIKQINDKQLVENDKERTMLSRNRSAFAIGGKSKLKCKHF